MEVVIDANVVFRMLISQGSIINILTHQDLDVYAPEQLQQEFHNHTAEIIKKSSLSIHDFEALTQFLFRRIRILPLKEYQSFLPKAKELLGEHE